MLLSRNFIIHGSMSLIKRATVSRSISEQTSVIQVGDPLPQCNLYEDSPSNVIKMPDLVKRRNVILFAVPGAFTPGCSRTHLPGFLKMAEDMKNNGIHEVICVSVNDPYVMGAWGEKNNTKGKIRMLADPDGTFTGAIGLGMRIPSLGGYRSKRFSMVIINNSIREINVEPDGLGLTCSTANVLEYKKYLKTDGDIAE